VTARHPSARLVLASLVDWTGTGFYLAVCAIFLTRSAGLSPAEAGVALAAAGAVAFAGSVPAARLGDRYGQRPALIALHVARAGAFAGLAAAPGLAATVALLSLIAFADQTSAGVTQALADELGGAEGRVALMARLRVVANVGITLGTVPAGLVLAAGTGAFGALLVANAGSYLAAAAIVATLPSPARAHGARGRARLLVPSRSTVALMAIDGVLAMWHVVLNVGLPLWVLRATAAPPALVAILYALNTVVAVALQARVSRAVGTYAAAVRAQGLAGLLLAACCAGLAAAGLAGPRGATVALCAAVLCLTLGELLKVSAAWEITYALAPPGRSAEFFATYGLGRVASQIGGPVLVTAVVLASGGTGWLLLAASFAGAGLATRAAARRARVTGGSAHAMAGEAGRREDAAVAGDAHGVVAGERRRPRGTRLALREGCGRVGVGRAEVGSDDRDGQEPGGRAAGPRVEDVATLLVLAGGRDGEVLDRDDGGEAPEVLRVADADPPEAVGSGAAAGDDVAPGVDAEARGAGRGQPLGSAGHRPALDES
jgi:hypothetical protein